MMWSGTCLIVKQRCILQNASGVTSVFHSDLEGRSLCKQTSSDIISQQFSKVMEKEKGQNTNGKQSKGLSPRKERLVEKFSGEESTS